jgi:hypothetical protein
LKFCGVRLQRPPQANNGEGKKVFSWNSLFGSGTPSTNAYLAHSASPANSALVVGSKLTSYLDSDHVSQFDDSFNILSWWHDHKRAYPVLSILVKDIMIVPISTLFGICI